MYSTSSWSTTVVNPHWLDHVSVDELTNVVFSGALQALSLLFNNKSFSYPSPYQTQALNFIILREHASCSSTEQRESRTLFHSCFEGCFVANRLAILTIASGKPSHFLSISSVISSNSRGQTSLWPNVLFKNNLFESSLSRGFIAYT
uniref:Uncharacterized protein n=1 Tax=Arundo donax TaxID=35708 RepID=A0A0A9BNZ0_ARUDO